MLTMATKTPAEAVRDAGPEGFAVATLTLRYSAHMTPRGRERIAAWLRKKADDLLQEADQYEDRFRARYLVHPDTQSPYSREG